MRTVLSWYRRGLALFALAALAGCGGGSTSTASKADAAAPGPKPGVPATAERVGLTQKIKVESGAGATVFSFKPKEDGAKVIDAGEKELFRLKWEGDKLKIKGAGDAVLGYVARTGSGQTKIVDASQQKTLFKIVAQPDGDMKVEDGQDQLLYRIKKREYGYEIETPQDQSLFKVKAKEGKTSLRDAADQTVLSTHDPVSAAAFAAFGLEKIERGLQCGLFLELAGR